MHARPVLRLLPALRRALSSSSSSAPSGAATETAAEKQRRALLERAFGQEDFAETLGIGGAGPVLQDLFRRAFASRLVQKDDAKTLGLRHVKGIMLHGAPGTGKTLIARKIAELLGDRRPKVVAGPDIYDHLLGQSEAKIRELFRASEDEWRRDKHNSALHVIVFDEIDAIARQRGGDKGGAGAGRDSVVNQLLAKIDGLQRQENLLIIGTTNRLDLVDPAVLRPGRLEVHVSVPLPDAAARLQILKVHTRELRASGAIGDEAAAALEDAALATRNFTGAELEAVVRSAVSHALNRLVESEIRTGGGGPDEAGPARVQLLGTDVAAALNEVLPALGGKSTTEAQHDAPRGLGRVARTDPRAVAAAAALAAAAADALAPGAAPASCVGAVHVHGPVGSGKTQLALDAVGDAGFALVRVVDADAVAAARSAEDGVEFVRDLVTDVGRADSAAVVLRDLDLWPGYALKALCAMLRKPPARASDAALGRRRLLVVATSAEPAQGAVDAHFGTKVAVGALTRDEMLAHCPGLEVEAGGHERSHSLGFFLAEASKREEAR